MNAHLTFLEEVGFDLSPDPENIRGMRRDGWSVATIAETYGVSERTIHRYLSRPHPCPGERCLTVIPGERSLCHFCRRGE